MSLAVTETERSVSGSKGTPVVNNVVIEVATANGSGSQSANMILMRSILNMGIPVSGKNLFPSNIQGLPTWFTIRANEDGWVARRPDSDFFIAMNPETVVEDIAELEAGQFLIINDKLSSFLSRDDLKVYSIPFDTLVKEVCKIGRLRKMVVNIIYVGVIAYLLDIEMEEVHRAVERQFAGKSSAIELNWNASQAGYAWAEENLDKQNQLTLKRTSAAQNRVAFEGNVAAALGMVFGGATVCAWYPITPSSSLCESFIEYAKKYRHDKETGKATYAVVQAEDELASIGMVVGAGWAGARSFTSTAGPGISLMSEIAGLAYFAEIPAVIVDVQRMGPSTGLPTRTNQGDVLSAYTLSHGDCKHVLLFPSNPQECFEFSAEALNLAERLQTLVFVMMDLDLGMNHWMTDPLTPLEAKYERGKVLTAEDLEKNGDFQRYGDVDGDAIGYRTLPGTPHEKAAYFTRGTGHTASATYSEKPHDWKENMDRLARKFDTARQMVPRPVLSTTEGAEVGLIAFGSSDPAVQEARHLMELKDGLKTDYLRLRALPIDGEVRDFIAQHRVIYVVEQNRDAQMASILELECPEQIMQIKHVLHYDGLPIDATTVVDQIIAAEKKETKSS